MGKKSLIKSTSKKKTGSTDPAPEKTAKTAAQSAKPVKEKPVKRKTATAKKAAPKKAATKKSAAKPASKKKAPATVKKAAPKKAAAKKSTTKPTAKKKAPATAKKTTPKKAAAKTDAAKPVVKDKAPATAKETAPQEATAKVEAVKPDVKKEAPPIATTGADAAKPAVKKVTPPVEEKTTSAPKVADTPKPKAVEAPPTTTAQPPKKETPPPEKAAPATPPVQDAVKDSAAKPAAPSAKEPQFTQPPERPEPSPEEQVQVSYDKPLTPEKPAAEPMNPIIKYGAIGLAFLIFLVLGASVTNSKRYYIKKRPLDIEISKGEFSPIGKKQLLKISGVAMPETAKATYNRNDVYPMIFQYYLNHADALLENSEAPDYDAIKVLINKAQGYAVTPTLAGQATRRVTAIDLHHLFYKASVTAEKGTIAGFDEGLDFLAKAKKLSLDESQLAMVDHKIAEMKDARARIEVEKSVKEIMTAPPVKEEAATH